MATDGRGCSGSHRASLGARGEARQPVAESRAFAATVPALPWALPITPAAGRSVLLCAVLWQRYLRPSPSRTRVRMFTAQPASPKPSVSRPLGAPQPRPGPRGGPRGPGKWKEEAHTLLPDGLATARPPATGALEDTEGQSPRGEAESCAPACLPAWEGSGPS